MALPVAHGLMGATIAALFLPKEPVSGKLKTMTVAALVAICPDFDYVFYRVLGLGESWHRTFSHSLLFALVVGLLASMAVRQNNVRSFLVYSGATFSHPILDALTTKRPGGVEVFWPFSSQEFGVGLVNYPAVFGGNLSLHWSLIRISEISVIELLVFGSILMAAVIGRGIGFRWGTSGT